ncbi:aminotransferase class V-fold PLP-dependent enzyme [Streptomyces sp. DH37]|uniref:pyridoxal phosphate-dependent decarboxylase family protein n=1 Tax=Streptomyces sp. DH37 TaxID=3040122 RepID=UPI002442E0B7|nr:aminotransferase class V-fold PLP-dependent enzyme [Streptomyces sp. DH37]MDG9703212.1 aminotransferase class V-fold PLP-dependent enzyme [Streptomyces sp. DH37]
MIPDETELLTYAAGQAMDYLAGLPTRRVGATAGAEELTKLLGGPLPEAPTAPAETVDLLTRAANEGGVVASSGPRYFGYVVGGTLPVALAADWIAGAWDQNSGVFDLGPAVATAEHIAAGWLLDLLGLPAGTSVGFPTGCAMAHVTALAAARHQVLTGVGWDVERRGLREAPRVDVVVGEQRHLTVDLALRHLGFGTDQLRVVPADDEGRMRLDELESVLADCDGPTIVCAQVGDVNTGAIDPVGEICDLSHRHGAWVHVDGAFGMWAAASPALRHLVAGIERADSWATDAHKWLNVPYDCGLVFVAHPHAHRTAMLHARTDYLPPGTPAERDPIEWVADFSRRARSLPVWAALRSLGRSGVADLIDRCCANARRFAELLDALPGAEVLNEVTLNQVLVRFGDDDGVTQDVIARLQAGGVCWFGGTRWGGRAAMRVSVTSWRTTAADVDRTVEEIRNAVAAATATASPDPRTA